MNFLKTLPTNYCLSTIPHTTKHFAMQFGLALFLMLVATCPTLLAAVMDLVANATKARIVPSS